MAYNYFPQYYQPTPQIGYPQQQMQNNNVQAQNQIQNGGFVSVRSEEEAMNYPVAHGMSVTFKNELEPYVYTKTMGFSQLDRPIFDKYRLVKEEPVETHREPQNDVSDEKPILNTIDGIKAEIEALWKEIDGIKNAPVRKSNSTTKKEKDGDD